MMTIFSLLKYPRKFTNLLAQSLAPPSNSLRLLLVSPILLDYLPSGLQKEILKLFLGYLMFIGPF
jgi:hypothetical protein